MIDALDIVQTAMPYIAYLSPIILVFCALALADLLIDQLYRLIRYMHRHYKI